MLLDDLIKYGKRSSILFGKEFILTELPYWTVRVEISNALERGDLMEAVLKTVNTKVNVKMNYLLKMPESEVMAFALHVYDSMKKINEMEAKLLVKPMSKALKNAGAEKLQAFGVKNTIDSLAKGDLVNYFVIKNMPYFEVFDKILMDSIWNDIKKELNEHN